MIGPPTVLVVDDEPDISEAVEELLEAEGYEVLAAGSGEGALSELADLKGARFDLLIVDYRMPRMDGLTFIRKARELLPGVPAILVTGYADLEVVVRAARDARVAKFLRKPMQAADLLAAVEEVAGAHWRARQRDAAFDRSAAKAGR